ncbi:MAG: hypothetical protein HYY11_03075 [Candidatus Methylomirabilis oxyfera]|nr:hypothetical protein [Candidatus Methylomirabilis oxyfera]
MSKSRRRFGVDPSVQPGLFDTHELTEEAGAYDDMTLVKAAMAEAIRQSRYKRLEVAFRLSTFLGTTITEDLLNQLTSSKPEYRLKADQLAGFCRAVGNTIVVEELLKKLDRTLLDPADETAIRLGRAVRAKQEAEREILEAQRDLRRTR